MAPPHTTRSAKAIPQPPTQPSQGEAPKSAAPMTVLLIDDEEPVRASVAALLVARQLQVIPAANGLEAVNLFRDRGNEIGVVILDMQMPEMDGAEVLRELRAIEPKVKVIICSGEMPEAMDARLDGCNRLAFAPKSAGPQELLAQLERLLERKL